MFGNFIYWTDWVTRSVMRINKFGGDRASAVVLIDKLDAQPMGIKVFSKSRQNCKSLFSKFQRIFEIYFLVLQKY